MKFVNKTHHESITIAIHKTEEILSLYSPTMNYVTLEDGWKYGTNMKGSQVVLTLCGDRKPIDVFTYRPWNPWSKAIAYYDGVAIHLNINKLSNDVNSLSATLAHEYAHHCGFKHGNNYKTKDKCFYSVPYFLSECIENLHG